MLYSAPLLFMRFLRDDFLPSFGSVFSGLVERTPSDLLEAVLTEGEKIAKERFLPINETGDGEGCHLKEGKVTLPQGFKEAYHRHKSARHFCRRRRP